MTVDVKLIYFFRRVLLCVTFCIAGWGVFESPTKAANILNLTWNAILDTNVVGFKIYYGTVSQQYTNEFDAGNATSASISGFTPGNTYFFAATSYNADGYESAYSTEVSFTIPMVSGPLISLASSAGGVNLSVNGAAGSPYIIFASTDLVNWSPLATNTAPFVFTDSNSSNYSRRFYQALPAPTF
jgi:hypothetical protein